MLVAPASTLFSTSSLTAPARSITTWPEQMRCTDARSMGLIRGAAAPSTVAILISKLVNLFWAQIQTRIN
jgi:hypothetical protein